MHQHVCTGTAVSRIFQAVIIVLVFAGGELQWLEEASLSPALRGHGMIMPSHSATCTKPLETLRTMLANCADTARGWTYFHISRDISKVEGSVQRTAQDCARRNLEVGFAVGY